jgi:raffinose/stachyose/melibiose transport system substrate-binding protein
VPFQINMGAGWPMQQWDKAALLFANDGNYYDAMVKEAAPYAADRPYGMSVGFVKELFDAGCTERDYTANNWDQSKALLGSGEAGMWFLANWSVPQAVAAAAALGVENASDSLGMFPLPIDEGGTPAVLLNPDWALGVSAQSKNKPTAKAWIEFLLTETDVSNAAGFIPGDPRIAPTMPQLQELFAANPRRIESGTPGSAFKQAMADARLDFMTGTYIRDLVLAADSEAAIAEVNRRWAEATGN